MTIFKPKNYNAIKNEINIGDAAVMQDTLNGYVGKVVERYVDTTVTPNVTYDRAFVPLTDDDLTTDNIWVALFTPLEQDRVEVKNADFTFSQEYWKKKGEMVRLFQITRHQMNEFEFTSNLVTTNYATVALGDKLIPTTDGSMKWVVGATATKAAMEVLHKDNLATGSMYFGTDYTGSFHTKIVTQ